ncbi:potassium channel family protein [Streptomyces sp. 6N223]|uniref:potassium channel family protein n=1 Tax=Streptomyces sp. 6N223 TaxID=3457412 RepID=UPI003FD16EF0
MGDTDGVFGFVVLAAVLAASIRSAWRDPAFRGAAVSLVATIATATLFYTWHEGWSVLDSLYFSMTTGLTIGYGDLAPTTAYSKAFTIVYALTTVGLFIAVTSLLLEAGERQRAQRRDKRRARRR